MDGGTDLFYKLFVHLAFTGSFGHLLCIVYFTGSDSGIQTPEEIIEVLEADALLELVKHRPASSMI